MCHYFNPRIISPRAKIGAAAVKLSIRSNYPPCPGKILPVSFSLYWRLNTLIVKSPMTEKMVAINSAIEVDLTGQVCSDSIGYRIYSGFGGQVDFIRGAARSKGGKPIIALPSTTKNGSVSKIVPHLKEGAGVVTSRGDVHYVVTEYGVAYLHGKSVRRRAEALIRIAHPNFRDELTKFAKEKNYI